MRMRMKLKVGPSTSMSRPETLSLTMRLSFAETAEELGHCFGPRSGQADRQAEVLGPSRALPCRKFFMRHDTFCALCGSHFVPCRAVPGYLAARSLHFQLPLKFFEYFWMHGSCLPWPKDRRRLTHTAQAAAAPGAEQAHPWPCPGRVRAWARAWAWIIYDVRFPLLAGSWQFLVSRSPSAVRCSFGFCGCFLLS